MKRFLFVINLLFISMLCFSQQNIPRKIIGQIPQSYSTKLYQIQVGAFKVSQNTENTAARLSREGFNPVYEKYLDFTRVMVTGIPANQVLNYLTRIKKIGFDEVIIREDTARNSISEKWEVTTPGSAYVSFEFSKDFNYIVVENTKSAGEDNPVHFGKYTMPAKDVINLNDLGVLRIGKDGNKDITFSFSPAGEPGKETRLSASKTEKMPEHAKTDLFCRTWKVVNSTDKNSIGNLFFISNAGTYLVTTSDGKTNNMSQWRWYDNKTEEFEYTHNKWGNYGRAKIIELTKDYLKFFDPGFLLLVPGYSNGEDEDYWELRPVN